jgi:hypothetical protein
VLLLKGRGCYLGELGVAVSERIEYLW